MKNKFTYKGFRVELLADFDLGDYYMATRGDKIFYSQYVLIPDNESLGKARHYIKHLIKEYWIGRINDGDWNAFLPEISTTQQLEEFVAKLEDEFDRSKI